MAWSNRIAEAAYTSPSGTRMTYAFENVSVEVDKKTAAFNFPDAQGTYIQDLGSTGRRYPLRIIFWGDDYDLQATEFEAMLLEVGTGRLEHPKYGVKDVVPFGTILRRDDLKTAANQAVIEVTFWETIGLVYPSSQADPASELTTAVDEFNTAFSTEYEEVIDVDSAVERVSLKDKYQNLLDKAEAGLQPIADAQANVKAQFDGIVDSINQGIDILVSDPLTLAFQTTLLIQAPARALVNITARLTAYRDLANSIISGDGAVVSPSGDSRNSNEFHTSDLYASTAVTGSILSVVNNQFATKPEALAAAESILTQLEEVEAWREENFASLETVDSGAAYQQLQEAVAIAAGFLVEISFSLKQERFLVLDRNRTIIDLVAELYGSIDDQLDFFITSNDLSGSEILELERGRTVVYYI